MARPLKILVAEDTLASWLVIQRLLQHLGHQPQRANNGRQAVELAAMGGFDLVLLDFHMPEFNGDEAARQIRAKNGSLPLIGMSASDPEEGVHQSTVELFLAAGMNDILTKPLARDKVQALLDQLFA